MQAMAVRAASVRTVQVTAGGTLTGVDPGLVMRMLRQWRFIASLGIDLVGFLAQLVALRRLPLFAVQAMIAANLARTPVLGAVAGLGYAVLAVAARILPGFSPQQLIRSPASYALAAAGIVSFMLYAAALDGGNVTVATSAVVLAETTPPALVGVVFLGDTTRAGLTAVAALGFGLAVVCAVALARFGEATEEQETESAPANVRAAGRDPSASTAC